MTSKRPYKQVNSAKIKRVKDMIKTFPQATDKEISERYDQAYMNYDCARPHTVARIRKINTVAEYKDLKANERSQRKPKQAKQKQMQYKLAEDESNPLLKAYADYNQSLIALKQALGSVLDSQTQILHNQKLIEHLI